jgi:hypothetical protein
VRVPDDEAVAGVAPGDDGVRGRVLHQVEGLGQERRRAHLVEPLHRPRRAPAAAAAAAAVLVLKELRLHNARRHRVHGTGPKNPRPLCPRGLDFPPNPNRTPKNLLNPELESLGQMAKSYRASRIFVRGGVSQRNQETVKIICAQ